MKVAVFSAKPYDQESLTHANLPHGHEFQFFEFRLNHTNAILAQGFDAVCCFVNDHLDRETLSQLHAVGVRLIALRCAGFNNVDLAAADELGLVVVRVPRYSPYAVAEHSVALILDLNRNIHRSYNRVREGDFSLHGLLGFDLNGKTVGVIGTGRIGEIFARIMLGFGCRVIAYSPEASPECLALGVEYKTLPELLSEVDILSLHCPLTPESHHLINAERIGLMKPGVMIINTSRGALIDTHAAIDGLKAGRIGYLGLDVYEEEEELFFENLSNRVLQDDIFARLLTFPNVTVTGHQAFFTHEALTNIAQTTLDNLTGFEQGGEIQRVTADLYR